MLKRKNDTGDFLAFNVNTDQVSVTAAIAFNHSWDILLRITFKGTVTFWAIFYRQVYHSLKEKRKLESVFLDELQHAEYEDREN